MEACACYLDGEEGSLPTHRPRRHVRPTLETCNLDYTGCLLETHVTIRGSGLSDLLLLGATFSGGTARNGVRVWY